IERSPGTALGLKSYSPCCRLGLRITINQPAEGIAMFNVKIVAISCLSLIGLAFAFIPSGSAQTPGASPAKTDIAAKAESNTGKKLENVELLFVQNAKGLSSSDGKLTLRDVEAMTICFSDRPARLAGHVLTKNFVPMWSQGKDSFLKDAPNANLSIFV